MVLGATLVRKILFGALRSVEVSVSIFIIAILSIHRMYVASTRVWLDGHFGIILGHDNIPE